MQRTALVGTYTETHELGRAEKVICLRAFPVTSITTITYASTPNSTDATALEVDTDFYLDASAGLVRLLFKPTQHDPGYVDVEYVGGMAADADAFVLAFPAIASAVDQQVIHEFNRRVNPGGEAKTKDSATKYTGELSMLKGVREVLSSYGYAGAT